MGRLFSAVLIAVSCLCFFSFRNEATKKAELSVLLDNIRNKEGKLYIFIYSYENQYPDNPYLNFEIDKRLVSNYGTLQFQIPEILTHGKYGVSILDDENANEDLDLFLGLPTEGYGFSNNVKPFLSMPDYNDIIFDLATNKKTVYLTLQYIL